MSNCCLVMYYDVEDAKFYFGTFDEGNRCLWTDDLRHAGRFTLEVAREFCSKTKNPGVCDPVIYKLVQ